jgi:hypothetical protein
MRQSIHYYLLFAVLMGVSFGLGMWVSPTGEVAQTQSPGSGQAELSGVSGSLHPSSVRGLQGERPEAIPGAGRPAGSFTEPVLAEDKPCACPEFPGCPRCPVCKECPQCPGAGQVCKGHLQRMQALERELEKSSAAVEDLQKRLSRTRSYEGDTALKRRSAAAKDNHLLLEFPSWGEDYKLSEPTIEKLALSQQEQEALEAMYRDFHGDAFAQLQEIYAGLMGDPDAGMDSTINGLIHNIMNLSPKGLCRERIMELLAIVAMGQPLPVSPADMLPCEEAIRFLFASVDSLEADAHQALGEKGNKALWSGTSSFNFSYQGNQKKDN